MLISSGGPLAQHCCVSKPLGLAGLPTLGERPTDKRAGARRQPTTLAARLTSTLACTGGTGSERGGGAMAEGLRHDDTYSNGARTSAKWPHRRGVDDEVARLGNVSTVVSEL
jgi:hypothetical protein